MSDRLAYRMLGAFWLLNAAKCATEGIVKYPDLSAGRIWNSIICVALFFYLAYRAWRKELIA